MSNYSQKDPQHNGDWENYKMYVVECIKNLTDSGEKIEKELNDIRLEFVTNLYKTKEENQFQLKELADTVLKLQIRVGLICAGLTIVISIFANVLIRLFVSGIN